MKHEDETVVRDDVAVDEPEVSRRGVGLKALGAALAGAGLAVPSLGSGWRERPGTKKNRAAKLQVAGPTGGTPAYLVSIYLRGGMDGLTTLAPADDLDYQGSRTMTRVWNPTDPLLPDPSVAGLPLTSGVPGVPDFWVPQIAQPLKDVFDLPNSKLAFFHACGSADSTRSHFEQQFQMETGTTGNATAQLSSGWCGRHLATKTDHITGTGLFRALNFSAILAQTLSEGPGTTPVPDPSQYAFPIVSTATMQQQQDRADALEFMYDAFGDPLETSMDSVLEAITTLNGVDFSTYAPGGGAMYPTTAFGARLMQAAQLGKEVPSFEVAHIDLGGWDTHDAQGVHTPGGRMYDLLDELSRGLKAFYLDMESQSREWICVVMTEFGRKVVENSSEGTDHGRGGVALAMGSSVFGGQVYTTWPGLMPSQQDLGDLAVTLDIRDVIGEIVSSALKNPNTDIVVPPEPGVYQYAPVGFLP